MDLPRSGFEASAHPTRAEASRPLPIDRRAVLAAGLAGVLAAASAPVARAETPGLRFSVVEGAGGVPLNVVEAGPADGPEILFLHGMSQSYLAWDGQLRSDLAKRFRLVAFDLRGHGNSGKPWKPQDYEGSQVWADDVAAVIAARRLRRPTLVGWSFGANIAMDYIRVHGHRGLSALNLVGNLGGLVAIPPNDSALFKRVWAEAPLRQSPDIAENITGFHNAAGTLSAHLTPEQEAVAYATGLMQGGLVRRALAAKKGRDNSDLAKGLDLPVLISVGLLDPFTPEASARTAAARLPRATVSVYPDTGHFISAEIPARFNRELAELAGRS